MSPKLDVEAIKARCEAATPGPWTFEPCIQQTEGMAETKYQHIRSGPRGVADTYHNPPLAIEGFGQMSGYLPPRHGKPEDAAFIAAARADVPALLAALEAERAKVTRLNDAIRLWGETGETGHLTAAIEPEEAP